MKFNLLLGIGLFFLSGHASAQEAGSKESPQTAAVEISFDEVKSSQNDAGSPPVEQIFKNPALVSGLSSGADAINRSIESLMDAMFYSLLDNELKFDLTDHSWFSTSLQRDVFSAPTGAYIVVDRINLGPRYSREMWNVHSVPVTLGAEGAVEVLQIYLRSDGQRVAEQQEIPAWRRILNNWFGLLPLVSTILPPSFNQNELYDPLRQLETPFVFPLSVDTFYGMPQGSIRSYAISGGASYSLGLSGFLDQASTQALEDLEGLESSLPYQVFVKGEHRINVLRRGEHIAWVGMSKVKRVGHAISAGLGNTLFLLAGAMSAQIGGWDWVWSGVPASVYPMDARLEQAGADTFDQLYEYDLRNPHAQEAYLAAVKGDFSSSYEKWLLYVEQEIETGVVYHFTRAQLRDEFQARNSPNLAVLKKERTAELSDAEVEITDPDGKFYILEAQQRLRDKWLDILVGEETIEHHQVAELKVKRVWVDPDDRRLGEKRETLEVKDRYKEPSFFGSSVWKQVEQPEAVEPADVEGPVMPSGWEDLDEDGKPDGKKQAYVFSYDDTDPLQVTMNFLIQDRYLDAEEYEEYMELIRFFTMLPMDDVTKIRIRDEQRQIAYRRQSFFKSPSRSPLNVHVTPTYLGKFGAQAIISFDTRELNKILETSLDDKWRAFARAFDEDPELWGDSAYRETLAFNSQMILTAATLPVRLFNVRFAGIDAIRESKNAIAALERIREAEIPVDKVAAFYRLFDAHHPLYLAHALLILADRDKIPRWVSISAEPKGSASAAVKSAFGKMNGRTYTSGVDLPVPTRYRKAKKKLAAFYLDQPRALDERPQIRKIEVFTKTIPKAARIEGEKASAVDKQVYVRIHAQGLSPAEAAKLYVRVEQAGKIQFGKLELAEKVLDLEPVNDGVKVGDQLQYEFFLTGPLSPLSNYLLDAATASGDDFRATLGVSPDGEIWSDQKSLEFRFFDGQLRPADNP